MGAHRSHSVSYPLSLQSGSVHPMAGLQGTPLTASSPCSCVNKGPGFGASPGDPSARWRSRAGAAGLSEGGCWSCRCPAAPCSRHQRGPCFFLSWLPARAVRNSSVPGPPRDLSLRNAVPAGCTPTAHPCWAQPQASGVGGAAGQRRGPRRDSGRAWRDPGGLRIGGGI